MAFGSPQSGDASHRTTEFLRLLAAHEDRTSAFVFSLVPHWADAQDIAQEVRMRLWEQFDAYDPTKDFGAWARTIAFYQVLAYRKRQGGRRERLGQESLQLVAAAFDADVERFEVRGNALRRCLQKLSVAKRRLLLRCYSGDETIRQVADGLGRSFGAVRKAVFRARLQLASCVQRELKREDKP